MGNVSNGNDLSSSPFALCAWSSGLFAKTDAVVEVMVQDLLLQDLKTISIVSPESFLEMQSLRSHCRPVELESAFNKLPGDLQVSSLRFEEY